MCDIDHIHEHAKGGTTDTVNGDPECGGHNRQKNRGYRTVRDPRTGRVVHYRPDGTPLRPAGPESPDRRRPRGADTPLLPLDLDDLDGLDPP
jgi:hypothetical protein